ncbi:hypothetical protein [Clostridium formicaceticum]|uniref:Uncharacterized protein n=1 Tax=Clostridium formicaceticum TaxID=1497 RepID=A0AAC9RIM2_9CLOT|nr:hypothetical protein [Clostridium formicaceticum]AOY77226.1 hypothetical protein BJL90_16040 [Clostridium formicaceticum]ARE87756.1 hypothetical protein CLFO_21560 [Clostridium formicaceticum]
MKKLYIAAAILGAILTPIAHKAATIERGYKAYGGEILIIPLMIIIVMVFDETKDMLVEIKDVFKGDEEWEKKERASSTTRC